MQEKNSALNTRCTIVFTIIFFILLYGAYKSLAVITPFIVSMLIAYLANPLVTRMQCGFLSRGVISFIVVLLLLVLLASVIFFVVPICVHQMINVLNFLEKNLIGLYSKFLQFVVFVEQRYDLVTIKEKIGNNDIQIKNFFNKAVESFFDYAVNMIKNLFVSGFSIVGFFSLFLVVPLVTFYFLKDWNIFSKKFRELIPLKWSNMANLVISEIDSILIGYITAQLLVVCILTFLYSVGLSAIGMHHGMAIGIFSGIISFLPYIGFGVGFVTSIIMSIMQFHTLSHILLVCVIFISGVLIDTQIISPKITAKKVGLHPILVIFSLFLGGMVMGFMGMIIAVPFFAIISVFIRLLIRWYKNSAFYSS